MTENVPRTITPAQAALPYPAVIYARVSTKDQADTGYSLDDQVKECLAYARSQGDDIPDACIFKEDYTGMSLNRPALTQIRTLIDQGQVARLYFWDLDRLSRKLAHKLLLVEACADAGVTLAEVRHPAKDTTPEDQALSNMRSVFAEYEYHKIRERTARGLRARAQAGYPPGGRRSFGYTVVKHPLPDKGAHYEIAPAEAALVRRIFDLYVSKGLSQEAIAALLTQEGVPTPGDAQPGLQRTLPARVWHQGTVGGILHNTAYTGLMHYGKKKRVAGKTNPDKKTRWKAVPQDAWNPIAVPALIDQATFDAAQARMAHNTHMNPRNRKHEYLFIAGRLRCGQCGCNMSGEMNGQGHPRYICGRAKRHYRDIAGPHVKRSVPARWIEPVVWDAVERALNNPALIAADLEQRRSDAASDASALERERQAYHRQLAQCDKDVKRWEVAFVAEAIDVDDFKAKKAEIAARRASAEDALAQLEAQARLLAQATLDSNAIETYCARVRASLQVFDLAEKRLALDALGIDVIWHHDGPPSVRGSVPRELYTAISEGISSSAAYCTSPNAPALVFLLEVKHTLSPPQV